MNTEVNQDVIYQCIMDAPSMQVLNFWGECLRIHKLHGMPHTKDEQFMDRCRNAFAERRTFLRSYVEEDVSVGPSAENGSGAGE